MNTLWPRTLIATAAVQNLLGGDQAMARARRPELYADAAYAVITRPSRDCTGNAFLCEDVLAAGGVTDGKGPVPDASGQVRPRRRVVRVHGHAGIQGPALRAHLHQDRPVRADLPHLLSVRDQGRPQAPARPRVDVPGMRDAVGPGYQHGDQRRKSRRAGGDSLRSAGKTRVRPGAARRSRNPPRCGMTRHGRNLPPPGGRGSQVKAPMPVMARPTMSVCMVSVPSKVWIASMSTMCRMT